MNKFDFTSLSGTWKFRACMAVAVLAVLCQLYYCFSYDIWFDESFSLQLIQHSFTDVIRLTSADIHAPFYYLILKLFVDGVHLLLPNVPAIFLGKMVSVIPFIILIAVCATKVRRQWGNYVAGVGAVCLACLRIEYGVEIRMYSFGLLFVTLAFLWLWDVLSRWDVRSWAGFVIFSLCAAYTHTYALLAVSGLWLALLIYVCVSSRSHLKAWGIAAAITIVGYLPWMSVLIGQVEHVSGGFWIEPLTPGSLIHLVSAMLNNQQCMIGWLFFAFLLILFNKGGWRKGGLGIYALTGILAPFFVLFVGAVVSVCIQPVLIFRYLMPGLGCLWIGQLIVASHASKDLRYLLVCLLFVMAAAYSVDFIRSERNCKQKADSTIQFLTSNDDAVYITDGTTIQRLHDIRVVACLTGEPCYTYKWVSDFIDMKEMNLGVFTNLHEISTSDEIRTLMSSGKHVYYISDRDMQEEYIIQSGQFAYKDLGLYKLGLFSANIYCITLADKGN